MATWGPYVLKAVTAGEAEGKEEGEDDDDDKEEDGKLEFEFRRSLSSACKAVGRDAREGCMREDAVIANGARRLQAVRYCS